MNWEWYRRKISKESINSLPLRHYEGDIRLVRSAEEQEAALDVLRHERLVGFDTETRPTFRKGKVNPPSLIQLAAADVVFLVQLTWLPLNADMAAFLADPAILKTGVSIHDDMRELAKLHPFTPAGAVDLGDISHALQLETHGLRNLAANFFDWRISKGPQCSNWSHHELSRQQILYAATDAWIGRMVFLKMQELGMIDANGGVAA